jgi:hypothetical protein
LLKGEAWTTTNLIVQEEKIKAEIDEKLGKTAINRVVSGFYSV